MKRTRNIISTLLAIVIAFSVFTVTLTTVFSLTLIDQDYLTKHFITDEVVAECENQLNLKFSALEKKSSIPDKVFKTVLTDMPVKKMMTASIDNFYNGHDSTAYSVDRADYFYRICTDYLNANNIAFDEQSIRSIADEAAHIYSDCVGFHNIGYLRLYIEEASTTIISVTSVALALAVASVILINILYGDRAQGFKYLTSGVLGAGAGGVLVCIIAFATGIGTNIDISPAIYQQGMVHCVQMFYLFFGITSLVVLCVGIGGLMISFRFIKIDKMRKESRFLKRVDKIKSFR